MSHYQSDQKDEQGSQVDPDVLLTRQGRGMSLKLESLDQVKVGMNSRPHLYPHLKEPYEVLVHALKYLSPDEAQWWSRGQAYTRHSISPAMWGLMKVAGKRLKCVSKHDLHTYITDVSQQHVSISSAQLARWNERLRRTTCITNQVSETLLHHNKAFTPHLGWQLETLSQAADLISQWVDYENHLLKLNDQGEKEIKNRRWGGQRRVVGALALDESLTIIGYALNHPHLSHTAHAEWCLLDQLWRAQRWPSHGHLTLLSSLKPCKLCAGAWISHAPVQNLHVYYL